MPRGFVQPGKVFKLILYLYEINQIPHNLFQHIKYNLESAGLE